MKWLDVLIILTLALISAFVLYLWLIVLILVLGCIL